MLLPSSAPETSVEFVSYWTLMKDPSIIFTAFMPFFSMLCITSKNRTIPMHMVRYMDAKQWQIGRCMGRGLKRGHSTSHSR